MPPFLALLIAWLFSASWPIVGQEGTRYFSAALFTNGGLALGLLALLPWILRNGRWRKIISKEYRLPFLVMGALGSGLASMLYVTAVQYTTAANAAVMAQIEVLYSAALSAYILKERITLAQAAGSLMVMLGTGIIMIRDLSTSRWKGDLLILVTPWMYQVSHIFAKRLPPDVDAVTIAGGRVFYGALSLLPVTLWALAHHARWSLAPAAIYFLMAQGIGLCSFNLVLWYVALRGMDLAKATVIMLSYPALTFLYSWALGRETIHASQLMGLALTISGACWVSLLVLRSHPAQAPESFIEA